MWLVHVPHWPLPQRDFRCGDGICLRPAGTTGLVLPFPSPSWMCPSLWIAIFGIPVYEGAAKLLAPPAHAGIAARQTYVYCIQKSTRHPRGEEPRMAALMNA